MRSWEILLYMRIRFLCEIPEDGSFKLEGLGYFIIFCDPEIFFG